MAHRDNIVDVLQQYDRRKRNVNRESQRATVAAVTPTTALVRIGGSQQTQEALMGSDSTVSVGDTVFVQPNNNNVRIRWIITSVISRRESASVRGVERTYREIFPPSNFLAINKVPGAVTVKWDVPVTYPVSIEVQYSTASDFATSDTAVITRGSYAIIDTDVEIYVRARSVAEDGQYSAWTTTITSEPAESVAASRPYLDGYGSVYTGFYYFFSDGTYPTQGS